MIAKCDGVEIGNFRIPPFQLNKGDFICICLYGGRHFYDLEMELVKLFTKQKTNTNLKMNQKMQFVEHFYESRLKSFFSPTTVGQYLKTNGKVDMEILSRIYEVLDYITPKTKVNTLAGNPRKWLSLFTTLSKSDKIVFDLAGQDVLGAEQTIDFVKEYTDKGGAAILLDNHEDSETKCTKFVRTEIIA